MAARAGVSVATVSFVVNGKAEGRVSPPPACGSSTRSPPWATSPTPPRAPWPPAAAGRSPCSPTT
ncbi:hypothetical protein ACFQX8_21225 [Klenkia terrae]|uniref:hypothetical protein n=1 Tax=Klenkia terrae TaxID=1052259 RepID=UPI0036192DF6